MKRRKQKWAIQIRNRYSGETIWLGSQYDSRLDAEVAAKRTVCRRCNSYSIVAINPWSVWLNRYMGFVEQC